MYKVIYEKYGYGSIGYASTEDDAVQLVINQYGICDTDYLFLEELTWEDMYDILEDEVGVCKQALDLAFGLNGCTVETAESILF